MARRNSGRQEYPPPRNIILYEDQMELAVLQDPVMNAAVLLLPTSCYARPMMPAGKNLERVRIDVEHRPTAAEVNPLQGVYGLMAKARNILAADSYVRRSPLVEMIENFSQQYRVFSCTLVVLLKNCQDKPLADAQSAYRDTVKENALLAKEILALKEELVEKTTLIQEREKRITSLEDDVCSLTSHLDIYRGPSITEATLVVQRLGNRVSVCSLASEEQQDEWA